MYASIDLMGTSSSARSGATGGAADRWHGQRERQRLRGGTPQPVVVEEEADEIEARIVRTKQFQMKPIAPRSALQMDLLDHASSRLTNADTGEIMWYTGVETEITGYRAREVANGRAREAEYPVGRPIRNKSLG